MDTENNESQTSILTDDIVQKIVGKTIIEMLPKKEEYLDIFFRMSEKPEDGVLSLAETAIEVITRVKTVEIIVLTTLSEFMRTQDVPSGSAKFMHYLCKDITLTLLLLNQITTPNDLLEVFNEEELKPSFEAFNKQSGESETVRTDYHTLAEDLKTFLGKIREAKAHQSSTT